jgi:exo-1,4-beta-D-glucosaminidase
LQVYPQAGVLTMERVMRVGLGFAAAAVLAAGSGVGAAARTSQPDGFTGQAGLVRSAAAAATGSSAISDMGSAGWKVLTSATANQPGQQISAPGFNTSGWLSVTNDDAGAPGTEIEALLQNGSCPNVFVSTNMKTCFGFMRRIGPDKIKQFSVPWWFRTDFTPDLLPGQDATLIVNGVVGAADVWVNGQQVATSATVTGAYTRFAFDITHLLVSGTNSLAIEMHPNDPTSMYTLDNVDWTQIPPDNNTGIQFPVQLQVGGALIDSNAHVLQSNAADLSSSALTVKTDITNTASSPQTGTVTATVTPPAAGTPVTVSQAVTVAANTTETVSFAPDQFPSLTIAAPQVWWPYQLGAQPLYTLTTSVSQNNVVLNTTSETFGIRNITSYLTAGTSAGAPDGVRAFKVNGVPIVIRGGGFDPDLFLHYSAADTAKQIALMKNMGVNAIRLEGHMMPEDWFQQMDQAGILINAGYQCCDAWEVSGTLSPAQLAILQLSALTIGENLRNHPSVFSFQWSDNAPTAQQESVSLAGFSQADFQAPLISSAEYKSSPQLGPSGEKEGPYDWVPPNYWYDTTHFGGGDETNAGGSWGYDSEQSAGDTVPTLDSINRFMSTSEQANLWQKPSYNQFHTNYEGTQHSGYNFGTLYNFDTALTSRYGSWPDLATYVQEAQVQNYENARAQFEAFIDHATNQPVPSTGTIYWQMNKGWPSLLWTLYNNDGDQAGSYFGAQQANAKLHALYALDNGTVTLDNLGAGTQSGLSIESRVYSVAGALLDDQQASNITLTSQQVANSVLTPKVPGPTTAPAPAQTYFVELVLRQSGTIVDRNVYWLSTQQDVTNWSQTLGQPQATLSQYANLQALKTLPQARIAAIATTTRQAGPNGADLATTVTITNNSPGPTVGFFLRADVRRGTGAGTELAGDNELQSSIWNDNDITLWPDESETLTATYRSTDLQGATPVISVSGWNMPKIDVATPVP